MNTIINKIKNVIKGSKFENRAYVVGGFVRDHFMGLGSAAIEFSAKMNYDPYIVVFY